MPKIFFLCLLVIIFLAWLGYLLNPYTPPVEPVSELSRWGLIVSYLGLCIVAGLLALAIQEYRTKHRAEK